MPTSCCVIGCTSRGNNDNNIAFHRIPKNAEKREKWIAAIRRVNWTPTESSRVCGHHFVTGRKNDDQLHVDYVPTLHMGYTSSRIIPTDARYHRQKCRAEKAEEQGQRTSAANILLEISQSQPLCDSDTTVNDEPHNIHDNCLKTITELKTQNKQLLQEVQCLQEERDNLKREIQIVCFGAHVLKDNDTLTSMYTGIPSYAVFMWILNFTRGKNQLSQEDIEKTRQLARVRIHVERAIGRIKAFHILSSVMPMNMVPHIDSVMVIVASICNLQPSLIS